MNFIILLNPKWIYGVWHFILKMNMCELIQIYEYIHDFPLKFDHD